MDKRNFFFKQRVQFSEMREAFDLVEAAERAIKDDAFAGTGFLMAAVTVVEDSPASQEVSVGAILGWDKDGKRVSEGSSQLFDFAGDDDPVDPRIASLYAKFTRVESNPRVDGASNTIQYDQDEGVVLERDLGTPAASPSPPAARVDDSIHLADVTIPAAGGNITNSEIDTSVQNLQSSFSIERLQGSSKNLEDAILGAQTAGASGADRVAILSDVPGADVKPNGYRGEVKILTDRTTPATELDIEFCRVFDKTNSQILAPANNTILDATAIGVANGLDAGALAADTWYYIYAIGDSTAVNPDATLLSLNPDAPFGGAPTLPAGYDRSRRIGTVRTDGGSNFINFRQINNVAYYEEQHLITSGATGSWAAVSLASRVPPTAERAIVRGYADIQAGATAMRTLQFADGAQAAAGAPVVTTEIQAQNDNESAQQIMRLHVDASQQIHWQTGATAWTTTEVYVRGYIDDSKEG